MPLAATIILMLPILYFLLASPTFLLRPMSDSTVAWMLRGLFGVHFALVGVAASVAAGAFALAGQNEIALGLASLAVLAIGARTLFLHRMDAALRAREAGNPQAPVRLRRIHWEGMAYNALQLVAVLAGVPADLLVRG